MTRYGGCCTGHMASYPPVPPPRIQAHPDSIVVPSAQDARKERHGFPELSLRVPNGWQERSVIAFALQRADTGNASMMVQRIECFDVGGHAARELMKQAKTSLDFDLLETRPRSVGARSAVEHVFRWTSTAGRLEQRIVYVEADAATAFVIACTCAEEEADSLAPAFEDFVAAFRIEGPSPRPHEAVGS